MKKSLIFLMAVFVFSLSINTYAAMYPVASGGPDNSGGTNNSGENNNSSTSTSSPNILEQGLGFVMQGIGLATQVFGQAVQTVGEVLESAGATTVGQALQTAGQNIQTAGQNIQTVGQAVQTGGIAAGVQVAGEMDWPIVFPTMAPPASMAPPCRITGGNSSVSRASVGASTSGVINAIGCSEEELLAHMNNAANCNFKDLGNGRVSYTCDPKNACDSVSINNSDGSNTDLLNSDNVRTEWSAVSVEGIDTSNYPSSREAADKIGSDYYYSGGQLWSRSGCESASGGGSDPSSNPSITPDPSKKSYDFCCVKNDKTDYNWLTGQTSKTCPKGYSLDSSKNKTTCKIAEKSACYQNEKTKEYIWTTASKVGNGYVHTDKKEEDCKNCYIDAKKWADAKSAIFAKTSDTAHPFYINKPKDECVISPTVEYCVPTTSNPSKQEKTTTICEDNQTISYQDGKTCSGTKYYEIKCDNKLTAKFDNNDDGVGIANSVGDVNTIFAGQGFGFGINVTIERTCTGEFYGNKWKADYTKISDSISGISNEKIKNELKNKLEDLKDIVKAYNSFDGFSVNDVGASITMTYKTANGSKNINAKLESYVTDAGNGKFYKQTEVKLDISGLTNPKNYTWSNNSKKIKLTLPETYIDSATGKVTSIKEGISGGNKLYIEYDAVDGTYPITVTLYSPSSGSNQVIKITDKKCSVKIGTPDYIYRPISVDNPFINNKREKGENWVNEVFDFTEVIHSTTWSEKELYSISLSPSEIESLKKNNAQNVKSGYAPYMGICNKLKKTEIDRVSILKKICDTLQ